MQHCASDTAGCSVDVKREIIAPWPPSHGVCGTACLTWLDAHVDIKQERMTAPWQPAHTACGTVCPTWLDAHVDIRLERTTERSEWQKGHGYLILGFQRPTNCRGSPLDE